MLTRDKIISIGEELTNVNIISPTDFGEFLGILSDKKTLLIQKSGWNTSTLGVSTDNGNTITWGNSFGSGGTYKITGFIETDDGEILISTGQKSDSSPAVGQVWKSTGWNKQTANASSWKIVTSTLGVGVNYDGRWGFNNGCIIRKGKLKGVIVIAEYGTTVKDAIANENTAEYGAVKVKISYDNGNTWVVILDLSQKFYNSNSQCHIHGCACDDYFERIIVTYGDGGTDGNGESAVICCNYEDLNNPIWNYIPSTNGRNPRKIQVTNVSVRKDRLEFISDSEVGAIRCINRLGYRCYGELKDVVSLRNGVIGERIFYELDSDDSLRLYSYQLFGTNTGHYSAIYKCKDNEFTELYRHNVPQSQGRGITNAVYSTLTNKVYANIQVDGTTRFFVADFV